MSQHPQFALFVSSVEGCLVTRYGTRTYIGASRRSDDPRQLDFHTDQVVAIPHDEYRRFRREYDRALREGSLARRTAEEWQAQNPPTDSTGVGTPRAPLKASGDKPPHDDPDRRRSVR